MIGVDSRSLLPFSLPHCPCGPVLLGTHPCLFGTYILALMSYPNVLLVFYLVFFFLLIYNSSCTQSSECNPFTKCVLKIRFFFQFSFSSHYYQTPEIFIFNKFEIMISFLWWCLLFCLIQEIFPWPRP